MKTFFKNLEYRFLVETSKIENTYIHSKLLCQKPMLQSVIKARIYVLRKITIELKFMSYINSDLPIPAKKLAC